MTVSVPLLKGVPPVSPAVLDCVERLPLRQRPVSGGRYWLPRLGVTVLAHQLSSAGWLCTLVTDDARSDRLPPGVIVVADVELSRSVETREVWGVGTALSSVHFLDAWRLRAAAYVPPMLVASILRHLDYTHRYPANSLELGVGADAMTVTADLEVLRQSACKTQQGLRRRAQDLVAAGLLAEVDGLPAGKWRRYRLTLPAPAWPTSPRDAS